jgi:hypothetical protein
VVVALARAVVGFVWRARLRSAEPASTDNGFVLDYQALPRWTIFRTGSLSFSFVFADDFGCRSGGFVHRISPVRQCVARQSKRLPISVIAFVPFGNYDKIQRIGQPEIEQTGTRG